MNNVRSRALLLRSTLVFAVGAATLTGCLRTLESTGTLQQYGAIVLRGTPDAVSGEMRATGQAIFFQAYSAAVPSSSNQTNTCQVGPVDTVTRVSTGQLQAGNALPLIIGSGTNLRNSTFDYEPLAQRYDVAGSLAYQAGDSITVSVPGRSPGFPAGQIKVRMAEPVTIEDVTIPAAGSSMTVRWNASPDPTTAVYLSVKYANPASSLYANEQILCSLSDDGNEELQASALTPFLASPVAMRSVSVTRWRTATTNPETTALLHIVSTVEAKAKFK